MLLQDNKERQVTLEKNPLTKEFYVTVYNKITKKRIVYRNRKTIHELVCECI